MKIVIEKDFIKNTKPIISVDDVYLNEFNADIHKRVQLLRLNRYGYNYIKDFIKHTKIK